VTFEYISGLYLHTTRIIQIFSWPA